MNYADNKHAQHQDLAALVILAAFVLTVLILL